jgi:spore maturation protein CgeB
MVGAAYLTEAAPGLDELYEIGREIETYRDASELAEKAAALGRDAARRQSLRERGQQRALADHTIGRTLSRITELLGIA